jgi:hypothetical protein
MESVHRGGAGRSPAFIFALLALELLAQILSLSMLPPPGALGGISAAGRTRLPGANPWSRPKNNGPVLGWFEALLESSCQSGCSAPEDDEREPAEWPHINLIVRQKAAATIVMVAAAPTRPTGRSDNCLTANRPAFAPLFWRSPPLLKLTC